MKSRTTLLALVVILTNVLGNLALTLGIRHHYFLPLIAFGVGLLVLWTLTRMALLSRADLSFVLPVTSLGYILTAMIGKIFLAESITGWRWLGTLLIMAGTIVTGITPSNTTKSQTVPVSNRKAA